MRMPRRFFARLRRLPLLAELDAGVGHHGHQHDVEDQQLAAHRLGPFFTGTSLRGTTPERLSRT